MPLDRLVHRVSQDHRAYQVLLVPLELQVFLEALGYQDQLDLQDQQEHKDLWVFKVRQAELVIKVTLASLDFPVVRVNPDRQDNRVLEELRETKEILDQPVSPDQQEVLDKLVTRAV